MGCLGRILGLSRSRLALVVVFPLLWGAAGGPRKSFLRFTGYILRKNCLLHLWLIFGAFGHHFGITFGYLGGPFGSIWGQKGVLKRSQNQDKKCWARGGYFSDTLAAIWAPRWAPWGSLLANTRHDAAWRGEIDWPKPPGAAISKDNW